MKISVQQCEKFYGDDRFEPARQVFCTSQGFTRMLPMITQILNNPAPVHECPGHVTYTINSEQDSVFYQKYQFLLIVDARGFQAKNLRCRLANGKLKISGKNYDKTNALPWALKNKRNMSRLYTMPSPVNEDRSTCYISEEGVMVVTLPWQSEMDSPR